jgi:hypothetical protein
VYYLFEVTNAAEYRVGVLYWLLHMEYLRAVRHPVYDLIRQCPSLLNEEPCEISLSHLARLHWSSTIRMDCQLLAFYYRLMPSTIRLRNAFMPEYRTEGSKLHLIALDSIEVKTTTGFMLSCIRQLETGQFRHYKLPASTWTTYLDAMATSGKDVCPPYFPSTPDATVLEDTISRARRIMSTAFCGPLLHLFPDASKFASAYRDPEAKSVTEPLPDELCDYEDEDKDYMEPEQMTIGPESSDAKDIFPDQV